MSSRRRRGFSLLEVVITMALVTLVASIVYQATTGSSRDAAGATARLSISQVLVAQQNHAAIGGGYTTDPAVLDGIDRGVTAQATGSTGPKVVSMAVSGADTLVLAARATETRCYVTVARSLLDGARVVDSVESGNCVASAYLPAGEGAR